ncbi:hypothetical protein EV182_004385 [Spiromyces aspiralis]|uniref:Uncharacterized protein n=1 Tax=Spiromyces aspiralis TaxID=68401 RepID=A0ACC1HC18_9FUNG|nr:hypothetical protein EV182_004385 [Spiromyces aspiralis]
MARLCRQHLLEPRCRLVASYGRSDIRPNISNNYEKLDLCLRCVRSSAEGLPNGKGSLYRDTFAVVGAQAQFFRYARQLYAAQPNWRFAWRLTVAGTTVHANLFGLNAAFGSRSMDVSAAAAAEGGGDRIDGLRQFLLRLLAGPAQTRPGGPQYNDGLRCWAIGCATQRKKEMKKDHMRPRGHCVRAGRGFGGTRSTWLGRLASQTAQLPSTASSDPRDISNSRTPACN